MDYQQPYQQQPQYNPPTPPPRKNRTVMWICIIGAIVLVFGTLVFYAVKVGTKIGGKMQELTQNLEHIQDSLSNNRNDATYEQVYARLGTDSVSAMYRAKIDSLRARTNRVCDRFDESKAGFLDTLQATRTTMLMEKRVAHTYFIESGRAQQLKRTLLDYRTKSIEEMPLSIRDTSLKHQIMIDEMTQFMPKPFKKLVNWEMMYFDQPRQTVLMNISTIKVEVRNFEKSILEAYLREIPEPSRSAYDTIRI